MSQQSLVPLSKGFAGSFLGDKSGQTTSAIMSDAIAELIATLTNRRPSRDGVMPWFHLAVAGLAVVAAARALR